MPQVCAAPTTSKHYAIAHLSQHHNITRSELYATAIHYASAGRTPQIGTWLHNRIVSRLFKKLTNVASYCR